MRAMLAGFVASAFALSVLVAAEAKNFGKCPVSGGPAKEEASMDYKGKKVYFCCDGCPSKVKADAKPFADKINHQLLVTKQIAQVGCPMSGGPVKEGTEVDFDGAKIGFCCPNCKGKFEKASADEKLKIAFAKFEKSFTMQSTCPVSGKPIKAGVTTEYKGKTVYFCCEGCPAAFEKDPEKYAGKLNNDDDEDDDDDEDEDEDK